MAQKSISIKEIAKMANVSVATVSRVINNNGRFSKETKEKVEAARAKILDGSFNVFDGEIETNTGEIIGKADSTLDDATITGGINWYYKNVEVK